MSGISERSRFAATLAILLALALASCSRGETLARQAPVDFSDGFESGDGRAFEFIGKPPAFFEYVNDPQFCHTGNWCAKVTVPARAGEVSVMWVKELRDPPLEAYYRMFFRLPADFRWNTENNDHKVILFESGSREGQRFYLNFRALGSSEARIAVLSQLGPDKWTYFNLWGNCADDLEWPCKGEPLIRADDRWHELEILLDQVNDHVTVWFDGKPHIDASIPVGRLPWREIKFGAYINAAVKTQRSFFVDDIGISALRMGPEKRINSPPPSSRMHRPHLPPAPFLLQPLKSPRPWLPSRPPPRCYTRLRQ